MAALVILAITVLEFDPGVRQVLALFGSWIMPIGQLITRRRTLLHMSGRRGAFDSSLQQMRLFAAWL